jgi:hypothetical protein
MAAPGILTVRFEVKPEGERMINRWYDEEHIADRLAIPGFRGVHRYRSLAEPVEHLTMWDVDDAAWPFDPVYRAIPMDSWSDRIGDLRGKSTRTGWEEIETGVARKEGAVGDDPGIRLVIMEIPPERAEDFDAWYAEDHIPALMERPEYVGIRRFRALDSSTYAAAWELTDCGMHLRDDFVPAEPTAWGRRMMEYRLSSQHSSWRSIPRGPAQS